MICCNECKFKIDINTIAGHRPVFECREGSPKLNDNGFARWPQIKPNEIGCANGIKKKEK